MARHSPRPTPARRLRRAGPTLAAFTSLAAAAVARAGEAGEPAARERMPLSRVVGTQTIRPLYKFTDKTDLVETAEAIRAMGSRIVKIYMGPKNDVYETEGDNSKRTLVAMARDEPSYRRVLDMPFTHYLIWAYPPSSGERWPAREADVEWDRLYRRTREFCEYLLRTYDGSGKTFLLGHWEGDWLLLGGYDASKDPTEDDIAGMAEWIGTRQAAVDDAKKAVPHRDVHLFNYVEVNLVKKALAGGRCVTNDVLPRTRVDFVSYSSYDTQGSPEDLRAALDHIQSKLPPRPIEGKRVFIGEYGWALYGAEEDRRARELIRTGLEWGCPFILYWEMHSNEGTKEKPKPFWLVDNRGMKQPLYYTIREFLNRGEAFVADCEDAKGGPPAQEDYNRAAVRWLAPAPFAGVPARVPGRIEAEHYDIGPEGEAYHDVTPTNEGGAFRADGVDLEACSDEGGGANVGWVAPGEWLRYAVEARRKGTYEVDLRVASPQGEGRVVLELDGKPLAGPVEAERTGGWQAWRTVTARRVELPEGEHSLGVRIEAAGLNLNWIEVRSSRRRR